MRRGGGGGGRGGAGHPAPSPSPFVSMNDALAMPFADLSQIVRNGQGPSPSLATGTSLPAATGRAAPRHHSQGEQENRQLRKVPPFPSHGAAHEQRTARTMPFSLARKRAPLRLYSDRLVFASCSGSVAGEASLASSIPDCAQELSVYVATNVEGKARAIGKVLRQLESRGKGHELKLLGFEKVRMRFRASRPSGCLVPTPSNPPLALAHAAEN